MATAGFCLRKLRLASINTVSFELLLSLCTALKVKHRRFICTVCQDNYKRLDVGVCPVVATLGGKQVNMCVIMINICFGSQILLRTLVR